jgi:hypothetical protein
MVQPIQDLLMWRREDRPVAVPAPVALPSGGSAVLDQQRYDRVEMVVGQLF